MRTVSGLALVLLVCQTAIAQTRGGFVAVGDMTISRWGHEATLLSDGKVLISGGWTERAEIYDPATRTFTATGSMSSSRYMHTATLLPDGTVLVAGGDTTGVAEIYDPATGTFTRTAAMVTSQFGHAATLLRNGKVLIAGGIPSGTWSASAAPEIYDPATRTFTSAGPFHAGGPLWPRAAVLTDGRVLLVGGNPAEIYDPELGEFSTTGGMTAMVYQWGTYWHTATTLRDGRVLVTGGQDDMTCGGFSEAEIYDPASGTFRSTRPMAVPRDLHTATLLRDGTVLIAGGGDGWCGGASRPTSEIFDPVTEAFVPGALLVQPRAFHTATLLNDGTVLLTGGVEQPTRNLRSAELYVPAKRSRAVRR